MQAWGAKINPQHPRKEQAWLCTPVISTWRGGWRQIPRAYCIARLIPKRVSAQIKTLCLKTVREREAEEGRSLLTVTCAHRVTHIHTQCTYHAQTHKHHTTHRITYIKICSTKEKFIPETTRTQPPITHPWAGKKKKSQPVSIKCPGKSLQWQVHRMQTI